MPSIRRAGWLTISVVSLTAALLTTASALAQDAAQEEPPAEEPGVDARARELYLRGDRAYAEGRYEESIELFREAHELSGRAQLMFNLANAYERAGRVEEAIAALRAYAPSAPAYDEDTIARRIRALELRLEEQQQAAPEPEPTPAPATAPLPDPEPVASEGGGGGGLLAAGLVLLGLGVAGGGVGLGLALAKQDATSELEMLCMNGLCNASAEDVLDRESSMALGADISFGVAGALGLAGLILTIAGAASGDDEEAAVAVLPLVAPGVGGLHVSTQF
ncbi:MAG: tetratricopeptide repeat protein [Sandaracinaceae bacterium]